MSEQAIDTWEARRVRRGSVPQRIEYAPFGELDFIDLSCPVLSVGVGPFGVTFQCVNHGLYVLTGDPADETTWIVRHVLYL